MVSAFLRVTWVCICSRVDLGIPDDSYKSPDCARIDPWLCSDIGLSSSCIYVRPWWPLAVVSLWDSHKMAWVYLCLWWRRLPYEYSNGLDVIGDTRLHVSHAVTLICSCPPIFLNWQYFCLVVTSIFDFLCGSTWHIFTQYYNRYLK